MKRLALYFTAPYRVSVQEESLAPPAADQVLVQTLVSAISPGTELLSIAARHPLTCRWTRPYCPCRYGRLSAASRLCCRWTGSCSGRADCSRVARPPGLQLSST